MTALQTLSSCVLGWASIICATLSAAKAGYGDYPWCTCAQRLIEEDKSFVQPAARRNEVLGWVEAGLRDFSISRAAVSWGIPIPRDPAQTVYVWFDALLGYMSGETSPSPSW